MQIDTVNVEVRYNGIDIFGERGSLRVFDDGYTAPQITVETYSVLFLLRAGSKLEVYTDSKLKYSTIITSVNTFICDGECKTTLQAMFLDPNKNQNVRATFE